MHCGSGVRISGRPHRVHLQETLARTSIRSQSGHPSPLRGHEAERDYLTGQEWGGVPSTCKITPLSPPRERTFAHQRKEVRGRRQSIRIFAKASAARHRHPRESGDPEKRKSICSRKRNPLRSSSPRSGVLRRGRTLCGHLGACRRAGTHTEFIVRQVRQAHHERSGAARHKRNELACLEQGYLTGQEWECGIRVRSPLSEGRGGKRTSPET